MSRPIVMTNADSGGELIHEILASLGQSLTKKWPDRREGSGQAYG